MRPLKSRLRDRRALECIAAKLLFLSKNRRNDGSPLCFQRVKITRHRFSEVECAACSNRFWFRAETMRSFACFADCFFNKIKILWWFIRRKCQSNYFDILDWWYNARRKLYRLRREEADIETPFDWLEGVRMSTGDCNGYAERTATEMGTYCPIL